LGWLSQNEIPKSPYEVGCSALLSTDNVNHPFGDFCSLLSAAGYTMASGHEAGWRHKRQTIGYGKA